MRRPLEKPPDRLAERLDALESRLRSLEKPAGRGAGRAAERSWILEGLRAQVGPSPRGKGGGRLGYAGIVRTPVGAHYQWQGQHRVDQLLGVEWGDTARAFAALGNRVRLDILRALVRGVNDVSELQRQPGFGTSGQLYHHLRELQAAGWVRQQERSRYLVVPDRVVCVMLMVGIVIGPDPRLDRSPKPRRKR